VPAALYPQEDSWYLFLLVLSQPQGHNAAGRIKLIEKSIDLFGDRTRNFPACSVVPQPTTLPHAPEWLRETINNNNDLRLMNLDTQKIKLFEE
jgi:hypothetical protein